jgi:hypothetical protein
LVALFAVITAAGCSTGGSTRPIDASTGDPATDAAAILARYRSTPAADASLAVRIKPAQGDALNIQLHIWCAADGRVRINASKLDVDFCSALLKPDGGYIVVAPRAHLAAVGTFDNRDRADYSPFFTRTVLISDEFCHGPLPPRGRWGPIGAGGPQPFTLVSEIAPLVFATITWSGGTGLVTGKHLDCGADQIAIAYSHEKDFDGLLRPTLATVTVSGTVGSTHVVGSETPPAATDTKITVGLRSFDGSGSISDTRMHLDVPADARTVSLDDLLKHLGD